jgi:hypothetical protein
MLQRRWGAGSSDVCCVHHPNIEAPCRLRRSRQAIIFRLGRHARRSALIGPGSNAADVPPVDCANAIVRRRMLTSFLLLWQTRTRSRFQLSLDIHRLEAGFLVDGRSRGLTEWP